MKIEHEAKSTVKRCDRETKEKMSGPQCCSNPPSLNPGGGVGHVDKVGGVDSYFTGSPHSKLAVLMLSDVFGYEAPNLRKLADKVGAAGYYVVVPDLLDGEPFNPQNSDRPFPAWIKDHGPVEKGAEATKPIIEALKSKGVSAIAAVGFCWGAKVVVELAKSRLIQTAVLLHPSFVSLDDIKGVDIPIAILGAEVDQVSPPELVKQFEQVLAAKSGRNGTMSGPECCSNSPVLNPNAGAGHVEKLAALDSYLSGSPNSIAILLVSDVFGYEAPNLRNIADKVAAAGYYVVVPDFFYGDPYNPENASRPLSVWLKDHGTDKGSEAAKSIIEALKSKGVTAIGAAGFCWGGKVVVELAKSRLIQADVLLHPAFVSVDDIKGVDIPTAVLGAEIDKMSPPELVKQFEQVLTAKPGVVDCFVKIFPKVSHGWTVRYNPEDAEAVKAAEEAHQDMLNWFAKHLKDLADKVARKNGCYCVCPDFFNGDPFDPENENRPLPVWLKDHEPEKGIETAKPVIEALKREGASAIGAAGFCWGGKTVTDLGKSKHVQASVLLHPAYVEVDDIRGIKTPIAILGGQNDTITPPKLIKQFKQALQNAKPKVDSFVKIFPNVSHGWTVRYDPKDPKAVKAAEKAHDIMIGWFDKYLNMLRGDNNEETQIITKKKARKRKSLDNVLARSIRTLTTYESATPHKRTFISSIFYINLEETDVQLKNTVRERKMLGKECYTNPPSILNSSSAVGHVINIGGVNSYVTGSPLSILAIILVSDIFGFKPPLLRNIADKVAATGYYVVVPDFFNGEPYDPENVKRPKDVWLKDHNPEKGIEVAKPVIEALKSKGVSAIGAAGFCWGAKTVTNLGKSKHIQVSVLLHPSYIIVDDIRGVEIPIAILGAENDRVAFPPKLAEQFRQALKAKPQIDSYVKIFPNVSHGWTVRYDPKDPKAVEAADKAHQIMIGWFHKHLK
ncbi:Endo-1,3-1,4-beta-D-glucanase [Glycine soja]